MKASELIVKLKELKEAYGDKDVLLSTWEVSRYGDADLVYVHVDIVQANKTADDKIFIEIA